MIEDYYVCGGCEQPKPHPEFVPVDLDAGEVIGINEMSAMNRNHVMRCSACAEQYDQEGDIEE